MRRAALAFAAVLSFAVGVRAESEVPPDAVVGEIPFLQVDEPNRIYLDLAREGGDPFRLMLDTGASQTIFTPLAARAAGVSVRALKNTPYRHTTRLGRDVQFYVDTRSSDTGAREGSEYGLLGANFLEAYVVELDFAQRRVRFLDPEKYQVPEQAADAAEAIVPMKLTSSRPLVDVLVDGRPLEVMFDTGCDVPLILSGSAAKSVGIDVDGLAEFGRFQTGLGSTPGRFFEARELAIGGKHFTTVPAIVSPKGWFNQGGSTNSAIGYDLISRFRVRIDYPRRRIWLRQQSDTVPYLGVDYASTREAGVFLADWKQGWYVARVIPDTPAARLGILAGDTLLWESAGDAEHRTLAEVLAAIRAGKPVRVARKLNDAWIDVDLPEVHREDADGDD